MACGWGLPGVCLIWPVIRGEEGVALPFPALLLPGMACQAVRNKPTASVFSVAGAESTRKGNF